MKQRVIALGFFDGVHLGHGGLLRLTRRIADQKGLCAAALTFDTHPDTLVYGTPVALLNTQEERAELMRRLYGIDEVLTLHFDHATMQQPWEEFVRVTLRETYHAAHVVCGHDYRFGAHGEGNAKRLAQACAAFGMECDCVPEICVDGKTVSSTRIRVLLEAGETEAAVRCLGHPHLLRGTVIHGRQLGRTMGIPTANFCLQKGVLTPRFGVYAAKASFDGTERIAVVNIGVQPTVKGTTVTVESWILDFDGDLYGHTLNLGLLAFLRPERKFDSLAQLRDEILQNAVQARTFCETKCKV